MSQNPGANKIKALQHLFDGVSSMKNCHHKNPIGHVYNSALHEFQRVWMAIAEAQSRTPRTAETFSVASNPLDRKTGPFASEQATQQEEHAASAVTTAPAPTNGARKVISDIECIFYDGFWVRYYAATEDSWAGKKRLIDSLTRRTFHHTEPGINTPGKRLNDARMAYEQQSDPALKRVNAAMLAGALFNRATDLFTRIVELEEQGVKLSRDNELMQSCGDCFQEALELGKQVKHHSGEEGIDELWGEPFRVFTMPMDKYYESRFIKVAQTMANINYLASLLLETLGNRAEFFDLENRVEAFAVAARRESETMKSDPCIFDIWPQFIATGERLGDLKPSIAGGCYRECEYVIENAYQTLIAGRDLINWVARARVPMPESTRKFALRCEALKSQLANC